MPVVGDACGPAKSRVPPLTVVPPVYVLLPDRIKRPLPLRLSILPETFSLIGPDRQFAAGGGGDGQVAVQDDGHGEGMIAAAVGQCDRREAGVERERAAAGAGVDRIAPAQVVLRLRALSVWLPSIVTVAAVLPMPAPKVAMSA